MKDGASCVVQQYVVAGEVCENPKIFYPAISVAVFFLSSLMW